MKVVLSWVKEFVDIQLPITDLAHVLTLAGLEVEDIRMVGLEMPGADHVEFKVSGLAWDPGKIVVAEVQEVMPHPNADRLVLCCLLDGEREHIVLTGAPNLYPYKGQGRLEKPLKVAYAREGAQLYDGHQTGQVLTTLKRAKIRGVESYSMICSEKELGISDEHEGVIILDDDAPVGMPLVDYMGDAVLDIAITPNIARNANILGVAREIAALIGQPLRQPSYEFLAEGPEISQMVSIEIQQPEMNPRFVLGLIQGVQIGPSPYRVQRRLRLAGMRPINNIVDATNYCMLEIGEPLHAFDYDVLVQRAGGMPTIITRTAHPGESLKTLDDTERKLDDFTVLVCDTAGALSIAGVMGGAESEVSENTQNILLEGAAWNFINIRRTVNAQRLPSEAAYRFSRGVHPAMAERGVRRCLEAMRLWAGGIVARGLVDNYPLPPTDPVVEITPADVLRWLGISLTSSEIAELLGRLEFRSTIHGETVRFITPDHRLDISEGVTGMADLMEDIARIYGYDRIPETRMADALPPQMGNPELEQEEKVRDILARLGLQEVINYRMTTPQREARRLVPGTLSTESLYTRLANPISSDRDVLRQSLLSSVLEVVERNARLRPRLALFEIGPVFLHSEDGDLPDEQTRLVIVLAGSREVPGWLNKQPEAVDFYDLKGIVSDLFSDLHLQDVHFEPGVHPTFHPGKFARLLYGEIELGVMGELHPLVTRQYDLPRRAESSGGEMAILAADLDLARLLDKAAGRYNITAIPEYPPVLEDLALIVDDAVPAGKVSQVIRQAAGKMLVQLELFDVYRGGQVGAGKKSLAYSLTYQAVDRTLNDKDVLGIRQRILRRLEQETGAQLRS